MILYEVTTGVCGESYQRCYVWAETEEEARDIVTDNHGDRDDYSIRFLFSSDSDQFVTNLSTEGWEP